MLLIASELVVFEIYDRLFILRSDNRDNIPLKFYLIIKFPTKRRMCRTCNSELCLLM